MPEHLAAHLAGWFPDLGGRVFAVTDVEDVWTKESAPTLPLCSVGVVEEDFRDPPNGEMQVTTTLALMFAFAPDRYKGRDGRMLPFWQYYNHEQLRDRLKASLSVYTSPVGVRVTMRKMDKDATEVAILFTFIVEHDDQEHCLPPDLEAEVDARTRLDARVRFTIKPISQPVYEPPPCEDLDAPCDGCPEQT